jgi:hypothetical protein
MEIGAHAAEGLGGDGEFGERDLGDDATRVAGVLAGGE